MGLFSKIFSSKEEKKEEVKENFEEETPIEVDANCCNYCHEEIFSYEQFKKFNKNKYHKKCFRKMRKKASHMLAYGTLD
jgi:hypothetical protein